MQRLFIVLVSLLYTSMSFAQPPSHENSRQISKIIYGSCIHQEDEQIIWKAINQQAPDLFLFLGDNIYGDTNDMQVLASKYKRLGENTGFQQLKSATPVAAVWDDHDYGANDAGKDYEHKHDSRKIMLDFFEEPEASDRRTRNSGIYTSYYFGEGEKRVQIILTDLRWNRTPPQEQNWYQYLWSFVNSKGPYLATTEEGATLLGEEQWMWLENELKQPASIRIIASSLQVIPQSSGWEAWAVFPHERTKLFDLLSQAEQKQLFLISGDTHWAEISQFNHKGKNLIEMTSSGLTEEWELVSPNEFRVGEYYNKANFGMIEIDWQNELITLSINDVEGKQRLKHELKF